MARYLYIEDYESFSEPNLRMADTRFPDDAFIHVRTLQDAIAALKDKAPFDGIVSDWNFPGAEEGKVSGLEFLRHAQKASPQTPFVFLSNRDPASIDRQIRASGLAIESDHIFQKIPAYLRDAVAFIKERYGEGPRVAGNGPDGETPPDALTHG